jgi:GTP-binding protein
VYQQGTYVVACPHAPQVPFCIVFTKCDARKKGGPTPAANIKAWQQEWLQQYEEVPACFETSAELGQGRSEVLNYLASLRVLEQEQGGEL